MNMRGVNESMLVNKTYSGREDATSTWKLYAGEVLKQQTQ